MNTKLLISAMAIVSFWPCAYAAVISPAALDASQGSPIVQTKALLQHQDLMTAEPLNWTEANSRVNQLGGWQAYMQESGMDHSKHQGMDHSKHQGMDHSKHQGMDHSKHQGMDHSKHQGMDHSKHQGMDHSKHQGMDHSKHQGMDHSKHQGMDHSKQQDMDHSRHPSKTSEPKETDNAHSNHH